MSPCCLTICAASGVRIGLVSSPTNRELLLWPLGRRNLLKTGPGPDGGGSIPGKYGCTHIPEKSGNDALAASACHPADETAASTAAKNKNFDRTFTAVLSWVSPQLTIAVTHRKVAGIEVRSLRPLVFWRSNSAFNSFFNSSARPFFSAASKAFIVGP